MGEEREVGELWEVGEEGAEEGKVGEGLQGMRGSQLGGGARCHPEDGWTGKVSAWPRSNQPLVVGGSAGSRWISEISLFTLS